MKTRSFSRLSWLAVASTLVVLGCSSGADDGGGGDATGGTATGGHTGTGGGATGGKATGGSATGGAATGGASTGGTSTGGASTGGATTGGAGPGGARGGSSATGGRAAGGAGTTTGGQGGTPSTGGGGSGATASKPSAGCGMATTQATAQFVQSNITSQGMSRPYSVRLPTGYKESRAYPVIVLLHGCGGGTNNVPMEKTAGSDAIIVRGTGSASGTCWDTAANGPDVAFFDAMVADTKARFCADESRVFVVGYSSGSWLVNQLTCIRSTVLRGGASVTGGESASGTCKGPVSRIFIHDKDDTTNVISGSVKARDRQLTQNGCDKSMQPVPIDPSPCVNYPGCPAAYPVEWCETSGQMHNRQDSLAAGLFWNFFKQF